MIAFVYQIRYVLLLLTATAGVLLWPGVRAALVVDNSLTVWFLEDDPALVAHRDFQHRFGNDETVILVVKDPQSLLSPAYFKSFIEVTKALEAIPEVEGVIGPGNTDIPTRETFGVFPRPLLTADADPAEVRRVLSGVPVLREQLFSGDYRTARFLIVLRPLPDFDRRRGEILDRVKETVYRRLPAEQVFFGGIGIVYAGLNALSQRDFGFFLGVGYLAMAALLGWIYRNPWLLAYPIGIVMLATYFTLGAYGALGFRINLMTILLPVIIVLLGVMDAVHVLNEHQLGGEGAPPERARRALQRVFYPCFFTTFTNAAGFLALATSPMAILRNFGIFAAIGIFLCLVFTNLLGVLLLPLAKPTRQATQLTSGALAGRLARLLALVLRKKGLFGGLSGLLVLFFAAGIPLLRTDTYTLGYFPGDHPVVLDHQSIEAAWGPYLPLEWLVEPHSGRTLHSVEVVRAARAFADSAKTVRGVGRVFGFHSLYQAGLEARYQDRGVRRLQSRSALELVYQRLRKDHPQLFRQFIHEPSRTGRITVFGTMLSARELSGKLDTLRGVAAATLGRVANVKPSGYQPLYAGIVGYVTRSQVNSLLLSFGLVFGLVWLFIRDFRLAALTVVPNLFPVLVMMGAMGWLSIDLDTATASIGAIVLSISVDDTVHFIHHYRRGRQAGQTPAEARLDTVTHVGPAIVLTSAVLLVGYGFMVFGSLKTVELWGLLTAISVVGALYGELIIFPIVLERFDRNGRPPEKPKTGRV